MKEKLPLLLSGRDQEALAEICSALRTWHYGRLTTGGDPEKMAEEVAAVLDRFDLTPQDLDRYYDRLHRAGENS